MRPASPVRRRGVVCPPGGHAGLAELCVDRRRRDRDIFRAPGGRELDDIIRTSEEFPYLHDTIAELEGDRGVSLLFSEDWPQVVSHGHLSEPDMLPDETTLSINGIIDWPLARIRSFGMELSTLRRTSGNMSGEGRPSYTWRETTEGALWAEFCGVALGHALTRNLDGGHTVECTSAGTLEITSESGSNILGLS
ncbi:hypothetical protein DL768_001804 [Monosporascus sp. mg162]|nr:hypothetical protein DL768_001804 [Monosporascus sp. mg162]